MSDSLSNISSLYLDTYSNSTSANSIENKLNNSDLSQASSDELLKVCKDFEEYFTEQMVKSMIKMTKINGDSDDDGYASIFGLSQDESSSDSYLSSITSMYGDQMTTIISKALCDDTNGKGLGLAQTLYEQMKRNYGIKDASD